MNIKKINSQIQEFCLASGFTFGGKTATAENLLQTDTFVKAEYLEWCKADNQTEGAKEMLDIAYFALTECWQYGIVLTKPKRAHKGHSITWCVKVLADTIQYGEIEVKIPI